MASSSADEVNGFIRQNLDYCNNSLEFEFNKCAQALFPANIILLGSRYTIRSNNESVANSPRQQIPFSRQQSGSTQSSEKRLPDPQGQAGGVTTSALLKVLYSEENRVALGELTYLNVLRSMRHSLGSGTRLLNKQDCIPLLHSSRPLAPKEPFKFLAPAAPNRKRKALLIGINYTGHIGELTGCHNDVLNLREYLIDSRGFLDEDISILMDYGDFDNPSRANILNGCRSLVSDCCSKGDSVLFHFSGHGGQRRDDQCFPYSRGQVEETLIPSDYAISGHITDVDLYTHLLCPLVEGVNLSCLIDCCHSSGPSFDLPYHYQHQNEDRMRPNLGMNFQRLGKICKSIPRNRQAHFDRRDGSNVAFKNRIPSLRDANDAVLLSQLVYKVRRKESSSFNKDAYKHLELHCSYILDDKSGLQVMVVTSKSSKFVAVVFRGSDEWSDWNNNRKVIQVQFGPKENSSLKFPWTIDNLVRVHRGFNYIVFGNNRFQKLADALETARRENPGYKVVFTGHSLGGACSILAGVYMAWSMPDCEVSILPFGSPRVGNFAFKEWVEEMENVSLFRYALQNDIVSRLPPAFLGYVHVGHFVHLEADRPKAYYRHRGDNDLELVGAPAWRWNDIMNALDIASLCNHHYCSTYHKYLFSLSSKSDNSIFPVSFESKSYEDKMGLFWEMIFPSSNELRKKGLI